MASIRNEHGAMLAAAIILLFFVSLFLFTLVSWHDSLQRTYDSLETYYENETMKNNETGRIMYLFCQMGDDMKKMYLIGYMGCGKSAIGKRLSFATKMPYYDMDNEIVKKMGMTIPEIFEKYGEEHFRDMETEFLRTFRDEYCIIATGGGVPMRKENREIMRRTGLSFF